MVSFDTQNPPGYELEAAKFLYMELAAIGFEPSLSEFKPGRANILARLTNSPGSIDVAHKPDEFVPRDELIRSSLIYRDVAIRILGDKSEPFSN